MPQFAPDQVAFRDIAGYGNWDIGHGREHTEFVAALAAQSPAIVLPDYPLLDLLGLSGDAREATLQSHYAAHLQLRFYLNIQGVDYSGYNLQDEGSFYDFIGAHQQEHMQLRQALGMT